MQNIKNLNLDLMLTIRKGTKNVPNCKILLRFALWFHYELFFSVQPYCLDTAIKHRLDIDAIVNYR